MKIGILQQRVSDNVKANMQHIAEGIEKLAKDGAQLIVLQELHNSLYFVRRRMWIISTWQSRYLVHQPSFTAHWHAALVW